MHCIELLLFEFHGINDIFYFIHFSPSIKQNMKQEMKKKKKNGDQRRE